jgi:hypothetical protein
MGRPESVGLDPDNYKIPTRLCGGFHRASPDTEPRTR